MSQAACETWVWGTRLEGAAKATAGLGQAKIDTASPEESAWFAQQNALLADATAKLEDALGRFPDAAIPFDQHATGAGSPMAPAEDSARRAIITILASAVSALEAALILADGREIVELGRLLDSVKRQKELAEERA